MKLVGDDQPLSVPAKTVYLQRARKRSLPDHPRSAHRERDGVVGTRESAAPTSAADRVYDHFAGSGPSSSRERPRATAISFAPSTSTRPRATISTRLVKLRFGVDRILPSYGTRHGGARRAPTAAAGAGTIWQGTRILVFASAASPGLAAYAVASDVPVDASATA